MSICAYCGSAGLATREHIWPRVLIEKYESLKTYNPRTTKFYIGEPVVKDVCAECNNVRLSVLDSYLGSLFDAYMGTIVEAGENVSFEYDYDLLLRALLKISYNSSRANPNEKISEIHEKFSQYILSGAYRPKVALRLQIVTASKIVSLDDQPERAFRPEFMRCGVVTYDGVMSHRFFVRMVAINSFWFYIVFPFRKETEGKWRQCLNGLSNWVTPTGVLVSSVSNSIEIPAAKTTFMHPQLIGSLLLADNA